MVSRSTRLEEGISWGDVVYSVSVEVDTDFDGIGIGYSQFTIDVDVAKEGFKGSLDWTYRGPLVFYCASF